MRESQVERAESPTEPGELAMGADKRVLRDLLRLPMVAQGLVSQGQDPVVMAPHDLVEGRLVAGH